MWATLATAGYLYGYRTEAPIASDEAMPLRKS